MSEYEIGNECYKQGSIQFGLERLHFHIVTLNLPQQQLDAYNEWAKRKRGYEFE